MQEIKNIYFLHSFLGQKAIKFWKWGLLMERMELAGYLMDASFWWKKKNLKN